MQATTGTSSLAAKKIGTDMKIFLVRVGVIALAVWLIVGMAGAGRETNEFCKETRAKIASELSVVDSQRYAKMCIKG